MKLAGQREVVIFSTSTCCMCRTVARLFRDLGANRRWWSWTRHLGRNRPCRRCSLAAGSSDPRTRSCPFTSAGGLSRCFVTQVLSGSIARGMVLWMRVQWTVKNYVP
uniref:Glutaredoxin domain-containing protein n=1 Tax=Hordeum vulgare subsp. vulgare TaxID=112509 RepID=A0A8I6XK38_HORVV